MAACSTRTGSGEREKVTSGAKVQEMCFSLHGALVSFPPRCAFSRPVFLRDMNVSNPQPILWTVCV